MARAPPPPPPPSPSVGRRGALPVVTALSTFVPRRTHNCCHSVATAHRVLQQRSARSCHDATDAVAHPLQHRIACCNRARCDIAELLHESVSLLQQCIACCNIAQQVRATTQPTLVPVRCNSASRVATALSAISQNCCPSVQSVATAHRMLQQRTILLQNRSTLHLLQRVATVQPVVMPVAAQCNLLWRNRTCCEKRNDNSDAH